MEKIADIFEEAVDIMQKSLIYHRSMFCLSISFIIGIYIMMNRAGGPTKMDYVAQAIIGIIIIGDVFFLICEKKKKLSHK
ncbi:hypothetical protein BAGA_25800 [Bacillus gaemokensis]|uniref:Uncharacterized protein n=1 Tax=Bacillus gaemokensis TaxID=574375 RepID=A0A073KQ99_9BACI|nr:hypothetical protein BAGA_25800 [Bacillus gaemokensis]